MELLEETSQPFFNSLDKNGLVTQKIHHFLPVMINNHHINKLESLDVLSALTKITLEKHEVVLIITETPLVPKLWISIKKHCYRHHVGVEWLNFACGLNLINELSTQQRSYLAFIAQSI